MIKRIPAIWAMLMATLLLSAPLRAAQLPEVDWYLLGELDPLTGAAPVELQKLDGQRVRVPGFVVPLELDGNSVNEFLLVPYFGACIHVPPPPANQMVFVRSEKGVELGHKMQDPVWITGVLSIQMQKSSYGPVGYAIEKMEVMEPYE